MDTTNNAETARSQLPATPVFLFVWQTNGFRKIAVDDVSYLEASRNYCSICLSGGSHILLSVPMLQAGEAFPSWKFIRISRSHIVNMDYVDTLRGNMLYIGEKGFTIGTGFRQAVFSRFRFLGSNSKRINSG